LPPRSPSQSVRHNGSYWADIFLTNGHGSPNPADASYNGADVYHLRKRASGPFDWTRLGSRAPIRTDARYIFCAGPAVLTRYHKKKVVRKEVNLLSGGKEESAEDEPTPVELEQERKDTPIVGHWHQNLTLALLTQRPEINLGATPAEVRECTSQLRGSPSHAIRASPDAPAIRPRSHLDGSQRPQVDRRQELPLPHSLPE
jgi:hypothetical protein